VNVVVKHGDESYTATAGTSAVGAAVGEKDGCVLGSSKDCVESFQLDKVFPHESILMLKIDVQGGEGHVLQGARNLIKNRRITCARASDVSNDLTAAPGHSDQSRIYMLP
jgi:FkbM family methyltransferase